MLKHPACVQCYSCMFSTSFLVVYDVLLRAFTMQFAVHETSSGGPDDNYYGLHATMGVYNHKLQLGQWSSAGIWVYHTGDGVKSRLNSIQVGWHVSVHFSFSFKHNLLIYTCN